MFGAVVFNLYLNRSYVAKTRALGTQLRTTTANPKSMTYIRQSCINLCPGTCVDGDRRVGIHKSSKKNALGVFRNNRDESRQLRNRIFEIPMSSQVRRAHHASWYQVAEGDLIFCRSGGQKRAVTLEIDRCNAFDQAVLGFSENPFDRIRQERRQSVHAHGMSE